jgi:5-methylcytosine-specific restriction endonuclease McrA
MELRTLVLSPWMQPHGVVGWQAAVVLAVTPGKVDVLEEYDVDCNSPSVSLKIPAVVRLRKAVDMHKKGVKFSRINVYTRDGYRCCYCGKKKHPKDLNYDHVLPRCRGGKTLWENIVSACFGCNLRKGRRTPAEAGLTMHFQPYRPKRLAFQPIIVDLSRAPEQWKPYLGEQLGFDEVSSA